MQPRGGRDGKSYDAEVLELLRVCYTHNTRFPSWVRDGHPDFPLSEYPWGSSCVYYPSSCDRDLALKVLLEREPVNIAMQRYFDEAKLKQIGPALGVPGWTRSCYCRYFDDSRKLAPNIAVFCRAPLNRRASTGEYDCVTACDRPDRYVNLLNVVAPALDSQAQPDWQYLYGEGRDRAAAGEVLQRFFEMIFGFIFHCADHQELNTILIPLFGCNNFGRLYVGPDGSEGGAALFRNVFVPALKRRMKACRHLFSSGSNIREVSVYGTASDVPDLTVLKAAIESVTAEEGLQLTSSRYGSFPADPVMSGERSSKMLLVNAWDPHSIAGNGNYVDLSLDGFIGRYTAVGALCWPGTNVELRKEARCFPVPEC
eukprot:TRINITY_DN10980_c0_g1_i1.p1 TRINITY_DN10980_c0_g1~~TRINITY_DN10980_c0_g1_i1.p1  ORF type:complete len:370 (+),score=35.36 TRINITY_DN10980_c0_g1_i1:104-1213(+)